MSAPDVEFNLYDYFLSDERLRAIADRVAIEFSGQKLSYRQLKSLTDHWADRLKNEGVSAGDRVALILFDSPEFIACFLATTSLGAICVPISTFLSASDVSFVLTDCGARLLIVEEELAQKHADRVESNPNTIKLEASRAGYDWLQEPYLRRSAVSHTTSETHCFILYTSGSTGTPKGVLHSHGSIPETISNYSKNILRLCPSDRVYSTSRSFFAYGLGNSLSFPLAAGATAILDPGRPAPQKIAEILQSQSPTVFFGVPAIYNALLDFRSQGGELDTSTVRLCISAGEALPPRVFDEWRSAFSLDIHDGIGSTEMLHIFISNQESGTRPGSSGKPVPGYDLKLSRDDGGSVSVGVPASLWVRGASAFVGYWGREGLTAETIREGWVRTGDLYRQDEDGFYFHVGRADDCFKVHGLWISPVEVESALLADARVMEAAVVPSVDEVGLATVRAFVVIRTEEATEELKKGLMASVRTKLPQYKVPSEIEFLSELPRTATGKVQRFLLRNIGSKVSTH